MKYIYTTSTGNERHFVDKENTGHYTIPHTGWNAIVPPANIENSTCSITGISEGATDVAKRIRQRVEINGKVHWVTGATQQDVTLEAARLLIESGVVSDKGKPESKKAPTFEECAWRWFNVYKKPHVKENTLYNYERDMINHVLPVFGNQSIDQIKPSDIQAFLNTKNDKAKSTVQHIWLILHGVFSLAHWDGYIEKDITEDAKRYKMSKKVTERPALSYEHIMDIIAHLDRLEGMDLLMLSLVIFTGMRRSEVLGLRWEDISFDSDLIHVQRAVTFKNNRPVLGKTKSKAGVRFIPLDKQLKAILSTMRQLSGYVIGQETFITERAYRCMWKRIEKRVDLHGATAHIFRHTYITMAVTYLDPKTMQSIAGHSDISTTMNRYAHGRKDKIIEAGHKLEAMYH